MEMFSTIPISMVMMIMHGTETNLYKMIAEIRWPFSPEQKYDKRMKVLKTEAGRIYTLGLRCV